MKRHFLRFWRGCRAFLASEDGPTAVEYGVLMALILAAAIAAITLFGEKAADVFNNVSDALPEAPGDS
jgi:pilus assembly protein Flp/PilA